MDLDVKFLISLLTSGAGIGAAWGHSQSKIQALTSRVEEIKKEKASLEKVENVLERLVGIEERLVDRITAVDKNLKEVKEDIKALRG
tara:strand:+ start:1580 stop:1840 length:261 start_codon:yes stop_codon:yes gene_type:complete